MVYNLPLTKVTGKIAPDRDRILIHAMFQVLIDFIEEEKGTTFLSINEINNWESLEDGITPHPFEFMFARASWFSRTFYWKRWRKLLAQAYLYHEIESLTGPDSTPEEMAYAEFVRLQQDLYLWYTREYKEPVIVDDFMYTSSDPNEQPTDDRTVDEKLRQLISIRHTLCT